MSTDEPRRDTIRGRIVASFERQGFMTTLGAHLDQVETGIVSIRLPFSGRVTQQNGLFHGGATSSIADSAGGYAALTQFDADEEVMTVEYKINLLAPARGHELEAIGTVLRAGRTLTVCHIDVYAHDNATSTLVAAAQQTLIRMNTPGPR